MSSLGMKRIKVEMIKERAHLPGLPPDNPHPTNK